MEKFTFIASINALEERVAKLEELAGVTPAPANLDQEEEEVEEEEPEE